MKDGELDYRPMQAMLDGYVRANKQHTAHAHTPSLNPVIDCDPQTTTRGLRDMCSVTHWPDDANDHHTAPSPCLFTEPTHISMVHEAQSLGLEVRSQERPSHTHAHSQSPHTHQVPPFRLDYGLGNAAAAALGMQCAVVQTSETDELSDHYPVECRYPKSEEERAQGYDWRR